MKKSFSIVTVCLLLCLLPLAAVDQDSLGPGIYAVMKTSKGEMVFNLDYTHTPLTVTSFVGLAEDTITRGVRSGKPFYDGLTFYRNVENYALFSGDPLNNGAGDPGYTLPRERDYILTADQPGTLVMTGLPTESNGAGFFITKGKGDSYLDKIYTPFGRIIEGEKVLDKLTAGDELESVTIIRRGEEAEAFKTDYDSFLTRYTYGREQELTQLESTNPEVAAVIRSLDDYSKTMSGIYYHVLYEGFGDTPKMGDTVTVHYTGALPSGQVFDSSVERNQPYAITIGTDSVIPGWLEAILSMQTGEVRTIVIPPNLAYGERGAGEIIPPNSWLVFQIQLLSIE
ncbi:MAG: FKBP-type peptidyl-prolyl cis-trans isomerase [Spirochaetales bacterium]|nr:FKBP-type peptidyl-prolyl cis-trans isomerase [Spirochaetales bacterium]